MRKTELLNKLRELIEENAELSAKNNELSAKVAELKAHLKGKLTNNDSDGEPQSTECEQWQNIARDVRVTPQKEEGGNPPSTAQETNQTCEVQPDGDIKGETCVYDETSDTDAESAETAGAEDKNEFAKQLSDCREEISETAALEETEGETLFAAFSNGDDFCEPDLCETDKCCIDDDIADIAASFVGRAVILVTEFTDEICSVGSDNTKELVTLALGKAEVFKSDTVANAEAATSAEEFSKLCSDEFEKLRKYINALRLSV